MRAKFDLGGGLIGGVALAIGLLLPAAPAAALSKNVFSSSFAGEGANALFNPTSVEVDQASGDVYVSNSPSNEQQTVSVNATGGTYTLTFEGQTTEPIAWNAPPSGESSVQNALRVLPALAAPGDVAKIFHPNVAVSGSAAGPYTVEFTGSRGVAHQPQITADPSGLVGGAQTVNITTSRPPIFAADVEKFTSSGQFILMFGKEVDKTAVEEARPEAEQNVCTAASGDECQPGTQGSSPGAFVASFPDDLFHYAGSHLWLAVDNSCALHKPEPLTGAVCKEFDPSAGDVYVGDPGDNKISKFDESGNLISTWGDQGQLDGSTIRGGSFSNARGLQGVAVDPTNGDLFVSSHLANLAQLDRDGSFLAGAESGEPISLTGSGIAVDAAGGVYDFANDNGGNEVVVYPQLLPGIYESQLHPHEVIPSISSEVGSGLAIDAATRSLYVNEGSAVAHYPASCALEPCNSALETFGAGQLTGSQGLSIDAATGTVYAADTGAHRVAAFTAVPYLPDAIPSPAQSKTPTEELLKGEIDPAAAGEVTGCQFEYVPANNVQTLTLSGATGGAFILGFELQGAGARYTPPIPFNVEAERLERTLESLVGTGGRGNVTVSGSEGGPYRVEFTERLGDNRGEPTLNADPTGLTPPGATVTVTHEPGLHWATATPRECTPNTFSVKTQVSTETTGLTYGTAYDFRLVAKNAAGSNISFAEAFTTLPLAPTIGATSVGPVFAEIAQIHARIGPNGGETAYHTFYHVEYVTAEQFEANLTEGKDPFTGAGQGPSHDAGSARATQRLAVPVSGLQPDTTYHYRVIASNECEAGKQCRAESEPHAFTTLPLTAPKDDTCPNAHVRQQTSAAQLLDCRAYELVSAAHTAGYDVESNLIEGQTPFPDYPEAKTPSGGPRVLYGVHHGGIPGVGEPTNRGVDPYVATRTEKGWSTDYVGIPANGTPSKAPFGSPLLEADSGLDTFAFGGTGICAPCFDPPGLETGVPLHLPGSEKPVQGMVAAPGVPTLPSNAGSDGHIAKPLSANGEHLIFGSTALFAEGGNDDTGDVSIYDRNLSTGETHVVSNTPEGEDFPEPLSCLQGVGKCNASEGDANGISELDVSKDGSRILIGQKVSEDDDHTAYYHLYMDVDDSVRSIDLTPGAVDGVLFDGMSSDGSKVFFSTVDQLHTPTNQDTDESADIYAAEISEGASILTRISTGISGTGDTDACSSAENWNTFTGGSKCDVIAIGGGGGVASGDGTIYFLSPELLDGFPNGIENQPNLYVVRSDAAPHFVATIDSSLGKPPPPPPHRPYKSQLTAANGESFSSPVGLAVDGSDNLWVTDPGRGVLDKFDPSGSFELQGEGPEAGAFPFSGEYLESAAFSNAVDLLFVSDSGADHLWGLNPDGSYSTTDLNAGLGGGCCYIRAAADNSGGATDGDLYVFSAGVVIRIDGTGSPVNYTAGSSAGTNELSGADTPAGFFGGPAGRTGGGIAVDSAGHLFVADSASQQIAEFEPSGEFLRSITETTPGNSLGVVNAVAVDPTNGNILVAEPAAIDEFSSTGEFLGRITEANGSPLGEIQGLAVDSAGILYVSDGSGGVVDKFGPLATMPLIDNPTVVDAVKTPGFRKTADFQVTPSGDFAAFPSTLALAGQGEETANHAVLYRYDTTTEKLACVSCTLTETPSTGDSRLASDGLSLTDEGRVFFDSTDPLAASDTDENQDVYEWEEKSAGDCGESSPSFSKASAACRTLISTGTSAFDSGLLGISADGTDAYFFTRDSLTPFDENGPTMKVYDAREGGGFPYLFPEVTCKASDECHGAASPAPGPLQIGSLTGAPRNYEKKCRKGFVKKHRTCVKKPKHHKNKHHRRAKHDHRGGAR